THLVTMSHSGDLPPRGQQTCDSWLRITIVHKNDNAGIACGANDASGGLNDLLHTGKQITVFVPIAKKLLHSVTYRLVDGVHLGQPQSGNKYAHKSLAGKVDPFTKGAAQHREADPRI